MTRGRATGFPWKILWSGSQLAAQAALVGVTALALASAPETAFVVGHSDDGSVIARLKAGEEVELFKPVATASRKQIAKVVKKATGLTRLFKDSPYAAMIHKAAHDAALDPALVHAVIFVESRYNSDALSPDGAVGLMQIQPNTASRYGVPDPASSVADNLRAGTRHLRDLMARFNGRLELVLAAYNAGEGAVMKYGEQIPPYKITQSYVPKVLDKYYEFKELLAAQPDGRAVTVR